MHTWLGFAYYYSTPLSKRKALFENFFVQYFKICCTENISEKGGGTSEQSITTLTR